jgi:hypothetical protein
MIQLVLFDVGETLIHNNQPLPHVREALQAIAGFSTVDGEPLVLGVVSDYVIPQPATADKIAAAERDCIELLRGAGLAQFFEPPEMRITLSPRAGVNVPDRRIFELAAERSGTGAMLDECLFVTANREHVAKCREYGITALRFGGESSDPLAFDEWSAAPLLIARLVTPDGGENLHAALAARLAASDRLELTQSKSSRDAVHGRAKAWVPLDDPALGEFRDVHVQLPVDVHVRLDPRGHLLAVERGEPDPGALAEARAHLESLIANQQIETSSGYAQSATTHRVEVDEQGRRLLKRQRFTMR